MAWKYSLYAISLAAAVGSTFALAQPAEPGDPSRGGAIADKLCSSCHATDPQGARVIRGDVPSFRAIAASPRTTPERLAGAIILPHPVMPNVPLTRQEIRDIIAYIMSLKPSQ